MRLLQKHFRLSEDVVEILEKRDKSLYPTETAFVVTAIRQFVQKQESEKKRISHTLKMQETLENNQDLILQRLDEEKQLQLQIIELLGQKEKMESPNGFSEAPVKEETNISNFYGI